MTRKCLDEKWQQETWFLHHNCLELFVSPRRFESLVTLGSYCVVVCECSLEPRPWNYFCEIDFLNFNSQNTFCFWFFCLQLFRNICVTSNSEYFKSNSRIEIFGMWPVIFVRILKGFLNITKIFVTWFLCLSIIPILLLKSIIVITLLFV